MTSQLVIFRAFFSVSPPDPKSENNSRKSTYIKIWPYLDIEGPHWNSPLSLVCLRSSSLNSLEESFYFSLEEGF